MKVVTENVSAAISYSNNCLRIYTEIWSGKHFIIRIWIAYAFIIKFGLKFCIFFLGHSTLSPFSETCPSNCLNEMRFLSPTQYSLMRDKDSFSSCDVILFFCYRFFPNKLSKRSFNDSQWW